MKRFNPSDFLAEGKEVKPNGKRMSLASAIAFLDKRLKYESYAGWSIRYYGHGEHFTFWPGDGTFIDWGIDADTKITWDRLREIIIDSAMARQEFEESVCQAPK